jgi:hypothetical protein
MPNSAFAKEIVVVVIVNFNELFSYFSFLYLQFIGIDFYCLRLLGSEKDSL